MSELSANNSGGGEAVSSELASTTNQGDDIETGANTEGEDAEGAPQPELDEVDYEGKKYKIPKELAPALLRQSDYTRKTQELADKGRSFEETQTAFQRERSQHAEYLQDVGKVYALTNRLEEWTKTLKSPEWATFEQANPGQAQALFRQYLMDKDTLDKASGELQQKVSQRTLDEQRSNAKRIEEGHAAVARDVKDWNQDTFGKVKDFGVREFGLKPEEVSGITDPRALKILHRAYLGDQAIKKLAASEKAAAAEDAKPLPQVGSTTNANSRRTTDSSGDKLSTAEWMKREQERTANRQKQQQRR